MRIVVNDEAARLRPMTLPAKCCGKSPNGNCGDRLSMIALRQPTKCNPTKATAAHHFQKAA